MNATASSVSLSLASFRSQTFDLFMDTGIGGGKAEVASGSSPFDQLLSDFSSQFSSSPAAGLSSIGAAANSAAGRNMSLNDPESGYRMMTDINYFEVSWKAEFVELSEMDQAVEDIGDFASGLGDITATSSDDSIKSQLKDFIKQYNDWIEEFDQEVQPGGLLANTQAAGVARHELEASVRNILNGSKDGINGLGDIGITVDEATRRLVFDDKTFDQMIATNREGVVGAIDAFSENFATAAKTVSDDGKFIHRQLDNLDRGLDYIRDNIASLRQEFGTGAAPRTEGQMAKAVSAYEKMVRA